MKAINKALILVLGCLSPSAFATLVPVSPNVLETTLKSQNTSRYLDGYVQLNKDKATISLVLQPVMPACPAEHSCTEQMPAPVQYFLQNVKETVDECQAVIYEAEEAGEAQVKVTIMDNTHYRYDLCPTFLPLPETTVKVEQPSLSSLSAAPLDESFAGDSLTTIQY